MNSMQHTRPPRAIITVAAENGAILGLYLILLAIFTGLGSSFGLATLLVWAGSIYLPFFLYRLMHAHYREAGYTLSLAELWAQGLMSFLLGSLLQAAAVYVLLRFVAPDFMASQMQLAIDTFRTLGSPQGEALATQIETVRSTLGVPTAADIAANLIVFNILCGAVIGLANAIILTVRHRSRGRRGNGSQTPQ